jgi:zinc transporter, ZIP family
MSNLMHAVLIGAVSALPLIFGAWFALKRRPSNLILGLISAFGAGALISAVAFELVLEASGKNSPAILATALALGAVVYFLGCKYLERRNKAGSPSSRGLALLMGATLDAIPESLILGISIAAGVGLSLPFLVAVGVSNLPEGMASAAVLGKDPNYSTRRILGMWSIVICISAVASGLGAFVGTQVTMTGAIAQAFAAGALLTMLTDDLIPEARELAGFGAGLAAVIGFAVAFALHQAGT